MGAAGRRHRGGDLCRPLARHRTGEAALPQAEVVLGSARRGVGHGGGRSRFALDALAEDARHGAQAFDVAVWMPGRLVSCRGLWVGDAAALRSPVGGKS